MKGKSLLIALLSLGIGFGAAKVQPVANIQNINKTSYERHLVGNNSNKALDSKSIDYKVNTEEDNNNDYSFEEYMGELLEKLSSEDIKKLKKTYEKAYSIQMQADKIWEKFDKELENIMETKGLEWDTECENGECENIDWEESDFGDGQYDSNKDFNEFLQNIKSELKTETYIEIKKLYEEAVELEEKEDYEKADLKLEKLQEILKSLNIIPEDMANEMIEEKLIAAYDVKSGKIVLNKENNTEKTSNEDIKKHEILWEKVKKLVPKTYINRIVSFTITTDGQDGIAASTGSLTDKNKKFDLAMDIKDSFDEKGNLIGDELNHTIIHEFGHILTLNDTQMLSNRNENSKTYSTEEGTTKDNSYLNKFYEKFWKNIYKEWEKSQNDEEKIYEFYEKNKDQFVTDYAATNVEEDIAESFTAFVMQDKPKGNNIKEKKILFFYNINEAVKLRTEIRKNLK